MAMAVRGEVGAVIDFFGVAFIKLAKHGAMVFNQIQSSQLFLMRQSSSQVIVNLTTVEHH